jgi:undecaprenyl-diphosphatase
MYSLFLAAVLGIIQGVTEFLPVSSTAHLLISERLLGFDDPGGVFTVMIQLGSIFAVMWLYRDKLMDVATGLTSRAGARHFVMMFVVATIPALIAGALFSNYITRVLYKHPAREIAVAFIVGGVIMLVVERLDSRPDVHSVDATSLPRAAAIGACQAVAIIPGISRSGATIVGGMAVGLDRATAAEFSFFLAMPTMAAAFAHQLLEVRHNLESAQGAQIAVGFAMAFLSSLLVVKPFLNYVRRSGFAPFAWYRIVLGAALLGVIAFR